MDELMKKRILFMVQVPPPIHGAALRNKSLVDSHILNEAFQIDLLPLSFADNLHSIGKFSFKKLTRTFLYAFSLIRKLLFSRPSFAYFTITPSGNVFYRDCLFVLILRLFSIRVVFHLRGLGVKSFRQKNRFNYLLYNWVFRNSFVICLSESHTRDIEGISYRKHFVVPNGIKVEFKSQFVKKEEHQKKQVLFLSNFIESKGVWIFLEAIRKVSIERKDFSALLVGEDFDITSNDIRQYLEQHQLHNLVSVSGPRYGDEKFTTIVNCDLFVFPTYFELFPGVVLEAMQCGIPVISTTTGSIPEIIDHGVNGILVTPKSVDEVAHYINHYLDNTSEAKSLGKNAQVKFYEKFTLDKFERNIKCVFEEVLKV
jgi:glycosyltransferase involved in cell wall biosynthesis